MADAGPIAVFRTDASAAIGGGHVSRCLTLATELGKRNWRCLFVTNRDATDVVPALRRSGVAIRNVDPADLSGASGCRDLTGIVAVVFDHYGLAADDEAAWRSVAGVVVAIDDLADRRHDVDILLDQTFGREPVDYRARVPGACRMLLGPGYALLRGEFAQARETSLARRQVPGRRLLITLGATDTEGVTMTILDAIAELRFDVADVLVGAANPHRERLRERAANVGPHVRIHVDADNVAALMAAADLAIGAAGSTSYERCCLGLPSVVVVTAANQALNSERLARHGAVVALGPAHGLTAPAVRHAVEGLLDDAGRMYQLSQAAAAVCDGHGAARVADRLEAVIAGGAAGTRMAVQS